MTDSASLGPWVRRFLLEHLPAERNLARNTQVSYRDTLRQLLPFAARRLGKPIERLEVEDLSAEVIRAFLNQLKDQRGCGLSTRNQRLAAVRSLSHFIALSSPEHVGWCSQVRSIGFKRVPRPLICYLEKPEMDALLAAPDPTTPQGHRDYALLLFLYNTGARADEAAHVRIADLELALTPTRDASAVLIRGKGNKLRRCPLWIRTVQELLPLVAGRTPQEAVFLNCCRRPLTRFRIHSMVHRYAVQAATKVPTLSRKRVSPHTIRHTTATHLLRSGVDINTIRAWLGHVSLHTTNLYAEVDLEMKAKALATCEGVTKKRLPIPWRKDADLMEFLRNL